MARKRSTPNRFVSAYPKSNMARKRLTPKPFSFYTKKELAAIQRCFQHGITTLAAVSATFF